MLSFNSIVEGADLPEVKKGPITRAQLVDYASASGDYNKLHYDEEFAKKAGLSGCIAHGMLVMSMVGSCVLEWFKGSVVKNYKIRFTGMTKENDTLTIKGKIVKKYQKDGEKLVEISLGSETQEKVNTTQGSAVVALKS